MFPRYNPSAATPKPGAKNNGVNIIMTPIFVNMEIANSVKSANDCGTTPSTARISCVHLDIILPVGVSSNQLCDENEVH